MNEYTLRYHPDTEHDFGAMVDFICRHSTREHALRYVERLKAEVAELAWLADALRPSDYTIPRLFHPQAKVLHTRNRKWSVVFHVEGRYVIVDRIIPSAMIAY
ncbi:MAG: type II toxin-antitoxin system RelE/ParE family toxin [Bacteroidales bacterium]|nr:type II toxin-antitoxin system RelE/ParE family toxin [Bacteroidales bacterium]